MKLAFLADLQPLPQIGTLYLHNRRLTISSCVPDASFLASSQTCKT